jgi:signal transduction histidine kinase
VRVLATGDAGPPAVVDADARALLDPSRLRVVLAAASVVLANTQLTVERAAHVAELRASRARIVEAGVAQRRELERDLHDGAQQHLLTVATTLSRAGLASEPQDVRQALDEAREQLSSAMAELRRLARGIHPVALSQGGLGAGLESLSRNHDEVTVRLGPGLSSGQRLEPAIESTTYFVVAECVTNARRHAGTPVLVDADCVHDELVAVVADTGPGGARVGPQGGLRGLLDRTQALGGTLVVDSPTGAGTTVRLRLPLTPGDRR